MKPADPVIIPGKLKRAMEASSYAANVLSALNEASYFLDIIESEYPEMFDESEIQDLKLVKSSVRNIIHQTNIATDPLFSHFEEAVSSYHAKSRYESVLIPKELVAYENDKRIRIQFPEDCDNAGYSAWMSKKFITDSLAGDMLQIRYYNDWEITLYRYESNPSGKIISTDRKTIDASEFIKDIQQACDFYMRENREISFL